MNAIYFLKLLQNVLFDQKDMNLFMTTELNKIIYRRMITCKSYSTNIQHVGLKKLVSSSLVFGYVLDWVIGYI